MFKYYYLVYYDSANIFSLNGYVSVYYDKKCKKIVEGWEKLDLNIFYDCIKPSFKKNKFICLGGKKL